MATIEVDEARREEAIEFLRYCFHGELEDAPRYNAELALTGVLQLLGPDHALDKAVADEFRRWRDL